MVIVGAGFGGIAAAIELQKHGFRDVTILDRAAELGGTWYHNDYPGSACDVPSHLYSFSFAQRRHWTRICSPRDEILEYLRGVARDFGVDRLVVPNTEVTRCTWDEAALRWTVASADGRTWEANAVVVATGQLHRPAYPRVEGRESYAGHSFHSAEWDHDYDLRGKRVAVIGTGASAVQFVPEIAKEVERLVVFQRTGNWFLSRKNHPYPRFFKTIVRRVPGVQAFRRRFMFFYGESLTMMIRHPRTWGRLGHARSAVFMRWQLRDPEVRRKVWPDYTFGCKRVLFTSHFLPALQRPNVELVTDAIAHLSPTGVVTEPSQRSITAHGSGDFMSMRSSAAAALAARQWADGAHAHLGITVPGFPSLFLMYGPNTNTSGGSIIFYHEAQAAYLRQALVHVRERAAAAIDVRPDAEAVSDRDLQARFTGTAWTRCDSWYRNDGGRIVANWPGYMREYAERTAVLDPDEYTFAPISARASVALAAEPGDS